VNDDGTAGRECGCRCPQASFLTRYELVTVDEESEKGMAAHEHRTVGAALAACAYRGISASSLDRCRRVQETARNLTDAVHDRGGRTVSLSLGCIHWMTDGERRLRTGNRRALLDDVRQLMSEQVATRSRSGRVLPVAENDIVPYRVGLRLDPSRRLTRPGIGVNAYIPEVTPEAGFEESPGRRIDRPAWGRQPVVHCGGSTIL
jgi:hypothetical protein